MKFTSRDQDNDLLSGVNCGLHDGGWWYRSCSYIEFNEEYSSVCMYLNYEWNHPTSVEMKIRPQNCNIN